LPNVILIEYINFTVQYLHMITWITSKMFNKKDILPKKSGI